jgi:DNA-binding GntR family transcriptional regulator
MITTKRTQKSSVLLRQYLCDEVTRIIKLRIFNLEYPRGSRLLVESLAQDLNVSMTPVREGLKSLVAEGLIVYDGKSYSVFNPTEKEIADIFNIRRMLERLSASLAARHMEEADLTYLFGMYRRDDVHRYMGEQSELINVDKIFHSKILEGADNPRLANMLESVEEQCWLIRAWCYAQVFPKWYVERTIEEHLNILHAIKARDEQSAGAAMEQHIANGEERTWEALRNSAMLFPAV